MSKICLFRMSGYNQSLHLQSDKIEFFIVDKEYNHLKVVERAKLAKYRDAIFWIDSKLIGEMSDGNICRFRDM